MKSITISEMRKLEEKTFASGVTVLELMERAGKECAKLINPMLAGKRSIIIFCGQGNNGGDGLVCARYLKENGYDVSIVLPIEPKTEVAQRNLDYVKKAGVTIVNIDDVGRINADIVVDALLGIGVKGALRGKIKEACRILNNMKVNGSIVVSIDVPTGLDADSGECDLDSVKPNATICVHAPKVGVIKAGTKQTGELLIADIGL